MEYDISLQLVLVDPPPEVTYAIQRGAGANAEPIFVQRPKRGDITFDVPVAVSDKRKGGPTFMGPFVQGPPGARFIYIGVGTFAGQKDSPWSLRMKVPLEDLTWSLILKAARTPGAKLRAHLPGTGKNGAPSCATVRQLGQWEMV